jgi:hypothetical protein|tara:strand:+ start:1281 stop:1448 length:168 start_codon:yes stop_codon:yes gene_type:complete
MLLAPDKSTAVLVLSILRRVIFAEEQRLVVCSLKLALDHSIFVGKATISAGDLEV